jgi:hypothetical protein
VYILATVRKPELLPAATLVFGTIRTGFPTAAITVQGNGLRPEFCTELATCCRQVNARFESGMAVTQLDRWLARLLSVAHEPFWICDTDMVFFGSMENLDLPGAPCMAGEYQPTFIEEYTRTIHMERLHTALLWINPVLLRDRLRMAESWFPSPPGFEVQRVQASLSYIHTPGGVLFYDTAAGLYHTAGGYRLSDDVLDRFEHLQCATYVDLIGPQLKDAPGLAAMHQRVYANPQAARGLRAVQREYYARRAPVVPHLNLSTM